MSQSIESETRDSSTARVPAVSPGRAIVFTRYDEEKSVVLHPDDYHRLASLDEELAAIALPGIEMSELALEAHRLEDTPGMPIEDGEAIRALLDL
jgi:hypothetical protein